MKTRIFGSLILLLVLVGLFLVSESAGTNLEPTQNQIVVPSSNDAAMKSLSIN